MPHSVLSVCVDKGSMHGYLQVLPHAVLCPPANCFDGDDRGSAVHCSVLLDRAVRWVHKICQYACVYFVRAVPIYQIEIQKVLHYFKVALKGVGAKNGQELRHM